MSLKSGIGEIGVLVLTLTLIAVTESKIDDECCVPDWDSQMSKVVAAAKGKLGTAAMKKDFADWVTNSAKFKDDDPEGICLGHLGYKCVGTGKEGLCKCNTDAPLNFVTQGTVCVAASGAFCALGPNPTGCASGSCQADAANPGSGVCGGSGGVGGTGENTNATNGAVPIGGSRVMWAIVGGLALLPIV